MLIAIAEILIIKIILWAFAYNDLAWKHRGCSILYVKISLQPSAISGVWQGRTVHTVTAA